MPNQATESDASKLTNLVVLSQNKKDPQGTNILSAYKKLTSAKTKEAEAVQNVEVPSAEGAVLKPPGNPGPGVQTNGTVFPLPLPHSVDPVKLAAGVRPTPASTSENVKLAPLPAPKLEG